VTQVLGHGLFYATIRISYSIIMILPFVVGLWSLCIQFVLNRIIYFYVANSEYSAATIISLHLMGFLFGSLFAKKFGQRINIIDFIVVNTILTGAAKIILWGLGVEVFGYTFNLVALAFFAFMFAFISGIITIVLINDSDNVSDASRVVVSDSVGSALGAIIGGFILVPVVEVSGIEPLTSRLPETKKCAISF
jgi:predicted MFS family arabinose efflux permease